MKVVVNSEYWKKKNLVLITLVIILCLIVVALSGFIAYDKILNTKNNESQVIENNQKEDNTDENNIEEEKTKEENDTNENLYEIFSNNLKNSISNKYDSNNTNYKYIKSDCVKNGYLIELSPTGELFVNYSSDSMPKNYKISDNVLSFYVINTGQDVCNTLYYINEDGTVSSAQTEYIITNDENIDIKNNIGNFKNIVSIVEGIFGDGYTCSHGPIFIDINGNIYSENLN